MDYTLVIDKTWDGKSSSFLSSRRQYEVRISFNLETSDMVIHVDAPYFGDPAPPAEPNTRLVGLWDYEVVEVFIASGLFNSESKDNYYIEVELGPHGNWYLCTFTGIDGERNDDISLDTAPASRIISGSSRWQGEFTLPSYLIPEPLCGDRYSSILTSTWMMNAFAIHGVGADREYLSYGLVPVDNSRKYQPNFHQIGSFKPVTINDLNEMPMEEDNVCGYESEVTSDDQSSVAYTPENSITPVKVDFSESSSKKKVVKDLQFRPSTLDPDAKKCAAMKQTMQHYKSINPVQATIAEVAKQLKDKFACDELPEKFARHLLDDEYSIFHRLIIKRSGWSYKKRMLVLTSKPRLLYFNLKSAPILKGTIPWTMTRPVTVTKINGTNIDIHIFQEGRVYHINDSSGVDQWIEAIEALTSSWGAYLNSTMGGRINLRELADSLKNP